MINSFTGKYAFLSNFYPCTVVYEGIAYKSSEHAYMAQKTLDEAIRKQIRELETPGKAKRFGRTVELRPGWENIKVPIMLDILKAKFTQNEDLKRKLLDTGDVYLEEGNTWGDKFWGTVDGQGQNMLGLLLMRVRMHLSFKSEMWS